MLDFYSKTILTIIAAALAAIAYQGFLPTGAQAQAGDTCGGTEFFSEPCRVEVVNRLLVIDGVVSISGPVEIAEPVKVEVQ